MKGHPLFVVVLLTLVLAAGCERRRAGQPRLGEVERLPRLETIVLGKPARLEVVRSYTATVEALEKAELCAMVRGYIKILPADIDIGRVVKKDEILLTLDIPDLVADRDSKRAMVGQNEKAVALAEQTVKVAQAEVKEAREQVQRYTAELEYRKLQYARLAKLAKGDTVSQQQAEESELQLNTARAALSAAAAQVVTKESREHAADKERLLAEARVKVARAELERAETLVDFATVRAPFDGIITKRWVDPGATVRDAGMPLLTVMRIDKVRVVVDVPERDAPYIQVGPQGNKVELQVPALQDAGGAAKFQGTITLMASALDPVTRTMRAEMHLDNRLGDKAGVLKPQMTGTARVTLTVREALSVPASALVRTANKMEICIVADVAGDPPRGTVKRVEVQLGVDDGLRVEIRNERLTGNELIIVKGAGVLRPGDQVIAVPARPVE
jgi:RND family efflux transporter MFP subunit